MPEHVRAWLRGLGFSPPHRSAWRGRSTSERGVRPVADAGARGVRVRRYDARKVAPLTWGEKGVTECAPVTRAFWRGHVVDQVQLQLT